MFLIKKHEVVFAKEFLIHLQTLQRTEDEIHEFSKNADLTNVKKTSTQRDLIARELKGSLLQLEEDIKRASNGKGPEDSFNFVKIKNLVYNIEDLLRKQLEELNKIEILEDNLVRTLAIDGMNTSGNSQLTYEIKTLRELLNSQQGVIAKYIVEEEHELEKESQTTSNQEDTRPEEIKKRFIISPDGQTIYDNQTKLTWERDWTKRKATVWENIISPNGEGFVLPSRNLFQSLIKNKRDYYYPSANDLKIMGFIVDENRVRYWTSDTEFDNLNVGFIFGLGSKESARVVKMGNNANGDRSCYNLVYVKLN